MSIDMHRRLNEQERASLKELARVGPIELSNPDLPAEAKQAADRLVELGYARKFEYLQGQWLGITDLGKKRAERQFNPFSDADGCQAVDVPTRLDRVKEFTVEQCQAALELPYLQKTVRTAVERRLKKLNAAPPVRG